MNGIKGDLSSNELLFYAKLSDLEKFIRCRGAGELVDVVTLGCLNSRSKI